MASARSLPGSLLAAQNRLRTGIRLHDLLTRLAVQAQVKRWLAPRRVMHPDLPSRLALGSDPSPGEVRRAAP